MLRGVALGGHRVVLRTARSPLRLVWSLLYSAVTRVLISWISRGERSSAYFRAGFACGDTVYGISDVDLALVVDGPAARHRVMGRWQRLYGRAPWLRELFDVAVYEPRVLAEATSATTFTYDLQSDSPRALYFGENPAFDESSLPERPRVYGPLSDWRLFHGTERLPLLPVQTPQERRIAAWLELQAWWGYTFEACANPEGPRKAHLCVKLVAEPTRILLWLVHGERIERRVEVLERGLELFPEEQQAFRRALELQAALSRRPRAPFAEFIPYLVRLSSRIAARLAEEVLPEGTTTVRLLGRDSELALPGDAVDGVPLADWRTLVRPSIPDEAFALRSGDPGDPRVLAASFAESEGPLPALRSDGLMVLPTTGRVGLRAIQCRLTDPVSFALADGRDSAEFPNVAGWSAHDWARRAVAEHGAWLASRADGMELTIREWPDWESQCAAAGLRVFGRLFTAARAALFLDSIERGAHSLPLTAAATAATLGAEAAYDDYRAARAERKPPSDSAVAAFRRQVEGLPAYADNESELPVSRAS